MTQSDTAVKSFPLPFRWCWHVLHTRQHVPPICNRRQIAETDVLTLQQQYLVKRYATSWQLLINCSILLCLRGDVQRRATSAEHELPQWLYTANVCSIDLTHMRLMAWCTVICCLYSIVLTLIQSPAHEQWGCSCKWHVSPEHVRFVHKQQLLGHGSTTLNSGLYLLWLLPVFPTFPPWGLIHGSYTTWHSTYHRCMIMLCRHLVARCACLP